MKSLRLLALGVGTMTSFAAPEAHVLWINVTPGEDAQRTLVASIGYGHIIPGDEILIPDWGPIHLATYEIIAPDATRSSLGVPHLAPTEKMPLRSGGLWQQGGDLGVRKIAFDGAAASGTYVLAGSTPVVPIIRYRDAKGIEQESDKPIKDIKDLAKVIGTKLEVNYMTSAFALDRWTVPAPVGYPLEIVPLTDLHAARPGEVIRFKVLLNGEPLTDDDMAYPFITATSPGYGDRWSLHSEVQGGAAEFRIPTAGPWRIDARFGGRAEQVSAYRDAAVGTTVWLESSFTFHLRP